MTGKQQSMTGVFNDIANAISLVVGNNSAQAQAIQAQLQSMQSLTQQLSNSLQDSLTASNTRMQAEASLSSTLLNSAANGQLAGQATQVASLGNEVAGVLSLFNGDASTIQSTASNSQQGAIVLAQLIQGLGADAQSKIAALLTQVENGQITMEQAIKSSQAVDLTNVKTVGDVATAFTQIITDYITNADSYFNNATNDLSTYNSTVGTFMNSYTKVLVGKSQDVQALATTIANLTSTYKTSLDAGIASATTNLQPLQNTVANDKNLVAQIANDLSNRINAETLVLQGIQNDENTQIQQLAANATTQIKALLAGYQKSQGSSIQANNLAVSSVSWPTLAQVTSTSS